MRQVNALRVGQRTPYQIGAFYMPNWRTKALGLSFDGLTWETLNNFSLVTPLKGRYHWEGDTELMNQQLAEAARHGLSYFAFDWYHNETTGKPGQILLNHALDGYLRADSRLRSKVKFAINWVTHTGFTPTTETEWEACYEDWAAKYLLHPDYLRVDGRPVIWVFETDQVRKNAQGTSDRFSTTAGFRMQRACSVSNDGGKLLITITDLPANPPIVGTTEFPPTGTSIQFRTTGTPPTGLANQTGAQKYYAIKKGQYTGHLATSTGAAAADAGIAYTNAGSGSHSVVLGFNWSPTRTHAQVYAKLFEYCAANGIPKPVVLVGGAFPTPFWFNEYQIAGVEGTSPYNYIGGYVDGQDVGKTYASSGGQVWPNTFAELAEAYEENTLKNFRDGRVPLHVPTLCTGWDNTPWDGPSSRVAIGTLRQIRQHFRNQQALMDRYPQMCRGMAIINAWNEYGEGGYCEPSIRYGRGILQAVSDVFGRA